MSYSSSTSSRATSPATSPSRPINFSSSTTSQRSSFSSMSSSASTLSNPYSTCAYPSWPSGSQFRKNSGTPSSYVSDEDLFGDDDDAYLSEPPPPPRPAEAYLARPLLPPVVPVKPRQCSIPGSKQKKRRSSKPKE